MSSYLFRMYLIATFGFISISFYTFNIYKSQFNLQNAFHNLMTNPTFSPVPCSLDAIHRLNYEQNNPCVIDLIRRHYLYPPPPLKGERNASSRSDPSAGQMQSVIKLLNYQKDGFFIECGALDGEWLSNTLYLEKEMNWKGILIEPNPKAFSQLMKKHRRVWSLPVCLSLTNQPKLVSFKSDWALGKIDPDTNPNSDKANETQCLPLYSILLAVNQTTVDFFSLDVEGDELDVLKTIPWKLVDIRMLMVEWDQIPGGKSALIQFMEENGYYVAAEFDLLHAKDLIFIKSGFFHSVSIFFRDLFK